MPSGRAFAATPSKSATRVLGRSKSCCKPGAASNRVVIESRILQDDGRVVRIYNHNLVSVLVNCRHFRCPNQGMRGSIAVAAFRIAAWQNFFPAPVGSVPCYLA